MERDTLFRRLVEKEHENHQLMSFILMEGLQLPELLPPAQSLFESMMEKYPAGSSQFIEGVPLLASGLQSNEFDDQNGQGDDDDYNY